MIFNFNRFNHIPVGRISLNDVCNLIGAQLKDLGHKPIQDDHRLYEPPVINVVFEHFDDVSIPTMQEAVRNGAKIVVVATENPTAEGFNGYNEHHNMRARMMRFPEVGSIVSAIWCLIPAAVSWYRSVNRNTHLIELGYSPILQQDVGQLEPRHDFSLYGQITPYRRALALELRKKYSLLAPQKLPDVPNYLPEKDRDAMVRDAKWSLHLKQKPDWNIISASRCATSLHLGRPVLSEWIHGSSPWMNVIDFAPGKMTDWDMPDWRAAYERQAAAFRTLTAEKCLGEAVSALT